MIQTVSLPKKNQIPVQQIVERVVATGQIRRSDHLYLTSRLLSSQALSLEERVHINRILDRLQLGQLRLVD
jgi:hypothetical protein